MVTRYCPDVARPRRSAAAGIDPLDALARADAGTALAAAGALFVTGPTGINAGDVMVIARTGGGT
jgi:glycerate-2-kinase